jgi:HEAT repeat protein
MDSHKLNTVQVIILVSRLLSEQRYNELGELARQDERIFNQLVETLRSGKGPFCFFAATSLGKVGQPAVEPLITAMQDEQYPVRQVSALALGEIGDPSAVECLAEALQDENHAVRQASAVALGKIGDTSSVEPLLQAIGDENEIVRRAVINALGMIGDAVAIPTLQWVIAEDTEAVAQSASRVIQQIQKRKR